MMTQERPYRHRISVDSSVHFGKPCVARTRIPVHSVLELVGQNISFEMIQERYYPDLELEDIRACVRYAADLVRSAALEGDPAP